MSNSKLITCLIPLPDLMIARFNERLLPLNEACYFSLRLHACFVYLTKYFIHQPRLPSSIERKQFARNFFLSVLIIQWTCRSISFLISIIDTAAALEMHILCIDGFRRPVEKKRPATTDGNSVHHTENKIIFSSIT